MLPWVRSSWNVHAVLLDVNILSLLWKHECGGAISSELWHGVKGRVGIRDESSKILEEFPLDGLTHSWKLFLFVSADSDELLDLVTSVFDVHVDESTWFTFDWDLRGELLEMLDWLLHVTSHIE